MLREQPEGAEPGAEPAAGAPAPAKAKGKGAAAAAAAPAPAGQAEAVQPAGAEESIVASSSAVQSSAVRAAERVGAGNPIAASSGYLQALLEKVCCFFLLFHCSAVLGIRQRIERLFKLHAD